MVPHGWQRTTLSSVGATCNPERAARVPLGPVPWLHLRNHGIRIRLNDIAQIHHAFAIPTDACNVDPLLVQHEFRRFGVVQNHRVAIDALDVSPADAVNMHLLSGAPPPRSRSCDLQFVVRRDGVVNAVMATCWFVTVERVRVDIPIAHVGVTATTAAARERVDVTEIGGQVISRNGGPLRVAGLPIVDRGRDSSQGERPSVQGVRVVHRSEQGEPRTSANGGGKSPIAAAICHLCIRHCRSRRCQVVDSESVDARIQGHEITTSQREDFCIGIGVGNQQAGAGPVPRSVQPLSP